MRSLFCCQSVSDAVKVNVVYDDVQNHLLFLRQVADVRLCGANEAGGTAEWRLLLH